MFNRVSLHGRFTAMPELKRTSSGTAVTTFYLAVDDWKSSDEEKKVNFFKCVAWAGTAETICEHFYKGRPIIVDGKLDSNNYTDKNGNKRTDVFVVVREIDFCDKKSDEANQKEFENDLNNVEPPLPFD